MIVCDSACVHVWATHVCFFQLHVSCLLQLLHWDYAAAHLQSIVYTEFFSVTQIILAICRPMCMTLYGGLLRWRIRDDKITERSREKIVQIMVWKINCAGVTVWMEMVMALRCNVLACERECERLAWSLRQITAASHRHCLRPPFVTGSGVGGAATCRSGSALRRCCFELLHSVDRSVDCSVRLFTYLPNSPKPSMITLMA